jgi:hypothetical protein
MLATRGASVGAFVECRCCGGAIQGASYTASTTLLAIRTIRHRADAARRKRGIDK